MSESPASAVSDAMSFRTAASAASSSSRACKTSMTAPEALSLPAPAQSIPPTPTPDTGASSKGEEQHRHPRDQRRSDSERSPSPGQPQHLIDIDTSQPQPQPSQPSKTRRRVKQASSTMTAGQVVDAQASPVIPVGPTANDAVRAVIRSRPSKTSLAIAAAEATTTTVATIPQDASKEATPNMSRPSTSSHIVSDTSDQSPSVLTASTSSSSPPAPAEASLHGGIARAHPSKTSLRLAAREAATAALAAKRALKAEKQLAREEGRRKAKQRVGSTSSSTGSVHSAANSSRRGSSGSHSRHSKTSTSEHASASSLEASSGRRRRGTQQETRVSQPNTGTAILVADTLEEMLGRDDVFPALSPTSLPVSLPSETGPSYSGQASRSLTGTALPPKPNVPLPPKPSKVWDTGSAALPTGSREQAHSSTASAHSSPTQSGAGTSPADDADPEAARTPTIDRQQQRQSTEAGRDLTTPTQPVMNRRGRAGTEQSSSRGTHQSHATSHHISDAQGGANAYSPQVLAPTNRTGSSVPVPLSGGVFLGGSSSNASALHHPPPVPSVGPRLGHVKAARRTGQQQHHQDLQYRSAQNMLAFQQAQAHAHLQAQLYAQAQAQAHVQALAMAQSHLLGHSSAAQQLYGVHQSQVYPTGFGGDGSWELAATSLSSSMPFQSNGNVRHAASSIQSHNNTRHEAVAALSSGSRAEQVSREGGSPEAIHTSDDAQTPSSGALPSLLSKSATAKPAVESRRRTDDASDAVETESTAASVLSTSAATKQTASWTAESLATSPTASERDGEMSKLSTQSGEPGAATGDNDVGDRSTMSTPHVGVESKSAHDEAPTPEASASRPAVLNAGSGFSASKKRSTGNPLRLTVCTSRPVPPSSCSSAVSQEGGEALGRILSPRALAFNKAIIDEAREIEVAETAARVAGSSAASSVMGDTSTNASEHGAGPAYNLPLESPTQLRNLGGLLDDSLAPPKRHHAEAHVAGSFGPRRGSTGMFEYSEAPRAQTTRTRRPRTTMADFDARPGRLQTSGLVGQTTPRSHNPREVLDDSASSSPLRASAPYHHAYAHASGGPMSHVAQWLHQAEGRVTQSHVHADAVSHSRQHDEVGPGPSFDGGKTIPASDVRRIVSSPHTLGHRPSDASRTNGGEDVKNSTGVARNVAVRSMSSGADSFHASASVFRHGLGMTPLPTPVTPSTATASNPTGLSGRPQPHTPSTARLRSSSAAAAAALSESQAQAQATQHIINQLRLQQAHLQLQQQRLQQQTQMQLTYQHFTQGPYGTSSDATAFTHHSSTAGSSHHRAGTRVASTYANLSMSSTGSSSSSGANPPPLFRDDDADGELSSGASVDSTMGIRTAALPDYPAAIGLGHPSSSYAKTAMPATQVSRPANPYAPVSLQSAIEFNRTRATSHSHGAAGSVWPPPVMPQRRQSDYRDNGNPLLSMAAAASSPQGRGKGVLGAGTGGNSMHTFSVLPRGGTRINQSPSDAAFGAHRERGNRRGTAGAGPRGSAGGGGGPGTMSPSTPRSNSIVTLGDGSNTSPFTDAGPLALHLDGMNESTPVRRSSASAAGPGTSLVAAANAAARLQGSVLASPAARAPTSLSPPRLDSTPSSSSGERTRGQSPAGSVAAIAMTA